jgi:hypothetical protein
VRKRAPRLSGSIDRQELVGLSVEGGPARSVSDDGCGGPRCFAHEVSVDAEAAIVAKQGAEPFAAFGKNESARAMASWRNAR